MAAVQIEVNPDISADQLWDFYVRNNICEVGFGKQVATRVLEHPQEIVGAFRGADLVGLARACFDGLSATIMELSLDLSLQGSTPHRNGSLIEVDPEGVGQDLAKTLLAHLRTLGSTFTDVSAADFEEPFYRSAGFAENTGHKVLYVDERPYVMPPAGQSASAPK